MTGGVPGLYGLGKKAVPCDIKKKNYEVFEVCQCCPYTKFLLHPSALYRRHQRPKNS